MKRKNKRTSISVEKYLSKSTYVYSWTTFRTMCPSGQMESESNARARDTLRKYIFYRYGNGEMFI